jgi:hypothetical protein
MGTVAMAVSLLLFIVTSLIQVPRPGHSERFHMGVALLE